MNRLWKAILGTVLVALFPVAVRALDPNLPPGGNFDLGNWKLQLPTSNNILTGAAGSVDEVSAASLEAGFTNAYLYTAGDGAMVFYAPNNGATTGGSTHPRSELREMINPSSSTVNWNVFGSNVLTGICVVSNVPSDTGKVCIGQMHEPNTKPDGSPSAGNELSMIMFDLNNQKIYANIDYNGESSTSFSTNFLTGTNVALGKPITYMLSVVNGILKIAVNNVTNTWNLLGGTNGGGQVFTNWDRASSNTVYFKAGSYNQVNNSSLPGGATVAFYSLTRWHSAFITNQPTNAVAGPGSNVTFTVGAVGNSTTLAYQWRLNTTTILSGATNATLTLTNISTTNVGNYTVVVTDPTPGFNVITSAVATLTGNFPPVITSQPADQFVPVGSNATLAVSATGIAPIYYRWWFNATNALAGATTNSLLVIPNAQLTNAGSYSVVVSNALGVVTSSVAVLTIGSPAVTSTNVWLDELWSDATRTNTALPNESAWFANNGLSLVTVTNALIGTPDPSVTLTWWTYFSSNAAPVRLAVSDQLRITLKFTASGIAAGNNSRGLRLGLYNSSGGTRTLADGANPGGVNHTGYMLNMNFGSLIGLSSPLQFLERTNLPSASLISTVVDYAVLGSGGPAVGTAGFSNGLPYTLVLTAKRNANSVDVTAAFSTTNGWSASYTATDSSATNADFDMFVFRPALQSQTATNFTFTELKVELVATNNHPPLASPYAAVTPQNVPLVLAVTNLLAGDADPDGDAIAITAVSSTSTNGGPVSLFGGNINYTPNPDYAGADRFSYTLTDARGAASTGFVFVTVAPPLQLTGLLFTNQNQSLRVDFTGMPGSNYVLQGKTNLSEPGWVNVATNATDANGFGSFVDNSVPLHQQRFYRVVSP